MSPEDVGVRCRGVGSAGGTAEGSASIWPTSARPIVMTSNAITTPSASAASTRQVGAQPFLLRSSKARPMLAAV